MRKRLFLKLLIPIVAVVGVSTLAFEILVQRNWKGFNAAQVDHSFSYTITKDLFEAAGISLVLGSFIALIGAETVSRRLQKIVAFTEQIEAGNLAARLPQSGNDEISVLAMSLDKTARQVETNFRKLEDSREQLDTLLNSMHDAVIAVSPNQEIAWFNGAMKPLAAGKIAFGTPLIRAVRDPDLLRVVAEVLEQRTVKSATLYSVATVRWDVNFCDRSVYRAPLSKPMAGQIGENPHCFCL